MNNQNEPTSPENDDAVARDTHTNRDNEPASSRPELDDPYDNPMSTAAQEQRVAEAEDYIPDLPGVTVTQGDAP